MEPTYFLYAQYMHRLSATYMLNKRLLANITAQQP